MFLTLIGGVGKGKKGGNMAWKTAVEGVVPPKGYHFEEDIDFLLLVEDHTKEIALRWRAAVATPESVQKDINAWTRSQSQPR